MTTTHTRALTAALGALMVLAAAAAPARAGDSIGNDTVSRAVSTAGLDLASPADQAVLRHRLMVAARRVCEDADFGEPEDSPDVQDCIAKARAGAERQVDKRIAAAEARSVVASAKP